MAISKTNDSVYCPQDIYLSKDEKISPKIYAEANREQKQILIQFRNTNASVLRYHLYKRKKGESFSLLVITEDAYYVDTSLDINSIYEYALRVESRDGQLSDFSSISSVSY